MAKRSKKDGRRQSSASASRKRVGANKPKGPRSQALPGMEKVTDQRLNNLCEAIAEDRKNAAHAHADEVGSTQAALKRMRERGWSIYKHAGVELVFVPGADKLRVRVTKDDVGDMAAPIGHQVAAEPASDEIGDEVTH